MKALIQNNKVVQVCEQEFEVHSLLVWVDAVDGCVAGWTYEGGQFTAPPAPPQKTYIENRLREYPPITDYIDGLVKGDQEQIDKYIADCLAVKAKYPKGVA
jgi:hypothetical protein